VPCCNSSSFSLTLLDVHSVHTLWTQLYKIHTTGQNVLFDSQTVETSTIIQACSRLISLLVQEKEKTLAFIDKGGNTVVGLTRGPTDPL
jgi:hypothetical protein